MVSGFLRMNLPQLQLVIVDDGTPLQERTQYDRLRSALEPLGHVFHTQANAGPGAARNKAAALAAHDLLLFFDADNVPMPELVERLWAAMSCSGADSIAAPFAAVPPMSRAPVLPDIKYFYRASGGSLACALFNNVLGDVCSLMRRSVFEALGGFPVSRVCWEDWELFLRLMGAGYRHLGYPDPLFFYTEDKEGRLRSMASSQAKEHECRLHLLSTIDHLPAHVAAELARVLATEHFVVSKTGTESPPNPALQQARSGSRVSRPGSSALLRELLQLFDGGIAGLKSSFFPNRA
jgi:GT2 family glycosyltransferase